MDALDCYTLALEWCPDDKCGRENKAVYYGNRAACHLKLEDFENVINDCTEALKIKDTYIKALIRRAEARERTEKYDLTIEDLNKVLSSQTPELTPAGDANNSYGSPR